MSYVGDRRVGGYDQYPQYRQPERYGASNQAVGWLRAEHNENLRRWVHWSIGITALDVVASTAYVAAVVAGVSVAPAVVIGASAMILAGYLVTGVGTLVNVVRGATQRKFRKR